MSKWPCSSHDNTDGAICGFPDVIIIKTPSRIPLNYYLYYFRMNWPVTILLLAAAAVVAYMMMEQPVRKQTNMNMKRIRLPYRPLSDTGSNKAAPTSFDTKALCATAAEC